MTDEKKKKNKKDDKTNKSKNDETQHTDEDTQNTQNVSSSRLQSNRSPKSVRSFFRVFTSRSTESKANSLKEHASDSHVDKSVHAAAKALSVTARWGLNRQSSNTQPLSCTYSSTLASNHITESDTHQLSGNQVVDEEVADKLSPVNVFGTRRKKNRKNDRTVKLCESLDASVLRDALVCQKDASSNPENENERSALTAAASNQDMSHTFHDVPPLDLQSAVGSRMSTLK